MKRFSVVIAGGGVAALEGLLRLHRLAGDRVAITLLAPDDHFLYRALSVNEPFSLGSPKHHSLAEIVRSGCIPRSAAMCAIGRSDSSASRIPRWINSSGYFFGLAIARGSP